jgi:cell fate regulator YaaT (PSP1 superfamily)
VYHFEAAGLDYELGAGVVVETSKGVEYGRVLKLPFDIEDSAVVAPLKPVLRLATEDDLKRKEAFDQKRRECVVLSRELVEKSGLDMKVADVEHTLDGQKMIVYFTAENRVDFRDLVRKMAQAFHTRIELRQIGTRDECRMVGGLGACGRACCCNSVLDDYTKSSIKMAKNQNLSLNPQKISGLCGRLMCCLEYENKHYAETNKKMPKIGSTVQTADNKEGVVVGLNQIKERIKLKIPDHDTFSFTDYPLSEVIFKGLPVKPSEEEKDDDVSEELKSLE